MKRLDFIVLGFMIVFVVLIIAAETKSQDYDVQFQTRTDRKSTRLNSSHMSESRMPSSA